MKSNCSINSLPFKIRAVQLDLARHFESVEYIKRYLELARDNKFNMVVLYLEGRIKTRSFPYSKDTSYTPDDMIEINAHARTLGLDVVPALAMLDHAEQFLACDEMRCLSEERDGRGRFSVNKTTFCPSLDETYDFIDHYIQEIALLFPGNNIHVGMDEAFSLGSCSLCKNKIVQGGLGKLFLAHILKVHAIVKNCGKRMWIWDDMFEFFPEELSNVPKDIVMAHWSYDENIDQDGIKGHFVNAAHRDWLALYETLGIDAVVCPWGKIRRNIESITDYGRRRNVLGAILTQWEGTPRILPDNKLMLTFAGRLWSSGGFDPGKTWQESINITYPSASRELKQGVSLLCARYTPPSYGTRADYFHGTLTPSEWLQREMLISGLELIKNHNAGLSPELADNIGLMECISGFKLLNLNLREIFFDVYNPRRLEKDTDVLKHKLEQYYKTFEELQHKLSRFLLHDQYNVTRQSCYYDGIGSYLEDARLRIQKPFADNEWLLIMRLFLKDYFGRPCLKVTAAMEDGAECLVAEGVFKSLDIQEAGGFYVYKFPFTAGREIRRVRIEYNGYGGQGVAYIEAQNRLMTVVPAGIKFQEGAICNGAAILVDDHTFAYLGNPDTLKTYMNNDISDAKTIVEIEMKPQSHD